jgi:hypothetical protein
MNFRGDSQTNTLGAWNRWSWTCIPCTGGCISRWRNMSDMELKDKLDNTTLLCHEIVVPMSAYGSAILKIEQAHYTNYSKSVHMVGHMMLGLTEYVYVLLDGREDVV